MTATPDTGIPSVAWKLIDGAEPGYTLYDLADRLRMRGWQVPAYPLTGERPTSPSNASWSARESAETSPAILLDDMRNAVEHFTKHPITVPMTAEESSGFSHL